MDGTSEENGTFSLTEALEFEPLPLEAFESEAAEFDSSAAAYLKVPTLEEILDGDDEFSPMADDEDEENNTMDFENASTVSYSGHGGGVSAPVLASLLDTLSIGSGETHRSQTSSHRKRKQQNKAAAEKANIMR